ncbi:MAG: methyltransferase domain-containing protein [Solirubrobacterales bacterium]
MSSRPASRSARTDPAGRLRAKLVRSLHESGWLRSDRVAQALAAVPREAFVRDIAESRGLQAVYANEALPAKVDGRGRWVSSSSQPSVMTMMLELLDPRAGERVLEVGGGTGYNAALLCELVGSKGRVTTIEIDRRLAGRARGALRESGHRARVVVGDGRLGFPLGAPYDRIIVTASAAEVPNAWIEQLRPGGRIVVPLRLGTEVVPQVIPAFERSGAGLRSVGMTWGGFMDLHDGSAALPAIPQQLNASYVGAGSGKQLVRVTGPAVERLSSKAQRRLLSLVLDGPRDREAQGSLTTRFPSPPAVLLWLLERLPPARRVELHADARIAVGLASRGGAAAVASFRDRPFGRCDPLPPHDHAARERWWLEVYGDGAPVAELVRLIDEWRSLPTQDSGFQIHVRRSQREHARIQLGWQRSE